MRFSDTFSGLLLVFFGMVVAIHAGTFPSGSGNSIGPGAFPLLMGGGLALGGAILAWSGWRQSESSWVELEEWVRKPRMAANALLVIGALVFYALAVETVGFFLTAFVLLAVLFLAFGVRRRWVAPIAVIVTLGLHVSFYTLLRVPLPWGWLEGMAW